MKSLPNETSIRKFLRAVVDEMARLNDEATASIRAAEALLRVLPA